jgi:uncharacterized protein (TIGR02466 family)
MHLFFSTPVWISEIKNHEKINEDLKKFIYSEKEDDPVGKRKSNIKGWHSKQFKLQDESLKKFLDTLSEKIREATIDMGWDTENQIIKITSMWSIINKKGSFNERHHHGNSSLSAAYYVNADENSGDLVFYDPRNAFTFSHPDNSQINDLNAQTKSIAPKSGMLVLFPSYLDHSVNASSSSEDRVVISFNVSLIPKRLLK